MPRFIIERNFADNRSNRDSCDCGHAGQCRCRRAVAVLVFLSADKKKKTIAVYEAPNAEAIREAARRLNIPADVITVVDSGD